MYLLKWYYVCHWAMGYFFLLFQIWNLHPMHPKTEFPLAPNGNESILPFNWVTLPSVTLWLHLFFSLQSHKWGLQYGSNLWKWILNCEFKTQLVWYLPHQLPFFKDKKIAKFVKLKFSQRMSLCHHRRTSLNTGCKSYTIDLNALISIPETTFPVLVLFWCYLNRCIFSFLQVKQRPFCHHIQSMTQFNNYLPQVTRLL